jgi:hypothetical protein
MYERFTERARRVFQLANQEAQRLGHEYIGTEHILLGLLREGSGVAAQVLQDLTLDARIIAQQVETLVQPGISTTGENENPRTPRAKKVVEYSIAESRNLNHGYVGTEHILLALLHEQEGVAGQVLANFGLEVEVIRAKVVSVLNRPCDWGRKPHSAWPPARPVEERLGAVVERPKVCPECGSARVIRVFWCWDYLSRENQEDVAAGKALVGSQSLAQGPPWVCLQCEPRWSEVHRLAMQDHEWQAAKENAVSSQDFDLAARYRDLQMELRGRLNSLVEELLPK